jgi:hypothetical protein
MFYVLHHPMDAETHNIPPGEYTLETFFSGGQVVGRQKPAYHQESCSNLYGVVLLLLNVSSHLYDYCCKAD